MFRKLRSRITYANVMSTIAVFLALGGVGAYAADEWNGSNIQDETLTGADVKGKPGTAFSPAVNGTLTGLDISGQAANAGNHTPFVQGSLTGEDIKDNTLAGADVNESTLNLAAEPWHEVGAAGEPDFFDENVSPYCSWSNFGAYHNTAAFLRDRAGIVHLKGLVTVHDHSTGCSGQNVNDHTIFQLPFGYRPAQREVHATLTNAELGRINVDADRLGSPGGVSIDPPTTYPNAKQWISLDGITFRCAPSGQDGCP